MTDLGIKITVPGKKALDKLYDERGIKKLVIVGRALEWVAAQDKSLQSIILGQTDPADTPAVLDMIKRRLEAAAADVSPAAQIVDETVAAAIVQKQRPGRRSRLKEA